MLTFMYYDTSINWKAVSTNIKTNEWFHIRAFWNNSLINQKRHIIGHLNPYRVCQSENALLWAFLKGIICNSKLDSPFLIRWNYSCHIIIKGYVTDRSVYLDYIGLFFWFSENCSFDEHVFLNLLTNIYFYLEVELFPLSELEMQLWFSILWDSCSNVSLSLLSCLKVLMSEYFPSDEHMMSPRDAMKHITVPQTEL